MKYIWLGLNWFFGVSFIIFGLASLIEYTVAAIFLILMGVVLLPPAHEFYEKKVGTKPSTAAKAIVFVLLSFLAVGNMKSVDEQKQKQEQIAKTKAAMAKAEAAKKRVIAEYTQDRNAILAQAKMYLSNGQYQELLGAMQKYSVAKDPALEKMLTTAKTELNKIKAAQRLNVLIKKVKATPDKDFREKYKLYSELVSTSPENSGYIARKEHYARLVEQDDRRIAEQKRKAELVKIRERQREDAKNTALLYPQRKMKVDISWSKGGFGAVVIFDRITITNNNVIDVKDAELECTGYANSGTKLQEIDVPVYEKIKAHGKKTVHNVNAGFVADQVSSVGCQVVSATPLE